MLNRSSKGVSRKMEQENKKKSKPSNEIPKLNDNQLDDKIFSAQPPKLKNHNKEINNKSTAQR